MKNLPMIPHTEFDFNREKSVFVAEASGLSAYSIRDGFIIIGKRKREEFVLSGVSRDRDGDVTSWVFTPVNHELLKSGLKAYILND